MSLLCPVLREFCGGCLEDSQQQVVCISRVARGLSRPDGGRRAESKVVTIKQEISPRESKAAERRKRA